MEKKSCDGGKNNVYTGIFFVCSRVLFVFFLKQSMCCCSNSNHKYRAVPVFSARALKINGALVLQKKPDSLVYMFVINKKLAIAFKSSVRKNNCN